MMMMNPSRRNGQTDLSNKRIAGYQNQIRRGIARPPPKTKENATAGINLG